MALKGSPFPTIPTKELIQQIESRRKAEKKLPTWFANKGIVYPPKLNLEQTSSEATAKHKAQLVNGDTIVDITGGFGVDAYYFSKVFKKVVHCENHRALSEIASYNFEKLGVSNVACLTLDGLSHLQSASYEVIYADPSRRHESKGKVFFLKDCEPNIPDNLDLLLSNCEVLMIKTSPMLDITAGLRELNYVSEIHIVAVHNEVKELLWLLRKKPKADLKISAVNISSEGTTISNFKFLADTTLQLSDPLAYLYEPNASIMKSGCVNQLQHQFDVQKLHEHTHLFTAEELCEFPGRRFRVKEVVPYNKKAMRKITSLQKANISIRNFPISVDALRKKWKLADGGTNYLFFVTLQDNTKAVLLCEKA